MNAIEQIFKPLERSIYKEKLILYLDKQTNRSAISNFLTSHSYIQINKQFVESPQESIEEYYPAAWKKSNLEVKKMAGPEKITLAENVGDNITKQQFETEMSLFFEAVSKCWDSAFD